MLLDPPPTPLPPFPPPNPADPPTTRRRRIPADAAALPRGASPEERDVVDDDCDWEAPFAIVGFFWGW